MAELKDTFKLTDYSSDDWYFSDSWGGEIDAPS